MKNLQCDAYGNGAAEGREVSSPAIEENERLAAENAALALALRESEARFAVWMDAIPDACVLLDGELNYAYMNRAAEAFSGLSFAEVKGRPVRIPPTDMAEGHRAGLLGVLRTGAPVIVDDIDFGETYGPRRFRVYVFKTGGDLGVVWTDVSAEKESEARYAAAREELRALAAHLLQVREDERKRVAREIHDELGQILTAIDMELRWLARRTDHAGPAARARLEALAGQSGIAIRTLQRIASELRPGILDHLGLSAAIEWFAADFSRRSAIEARVSVDLAGATLEDKASTALFRITQEALTNAARHARATAVSISLRKSDDAIELEIRDDGIGIAEERASDPKSFGLLGMRERVNELGGRLSIRGEPGRGTLIRVAVPARSPGGPR